MGISFELKSKKRICVIGDLMIDHYIHGNCNRISPEAPVPVVEVFTETHTLGGAGNVLKNLFALSVPVDIISVTGDDANAAIVCDQLSQYGVTGNGILKDSSRCTTTKSRILASNHQLVRLDRENSEAIDSAIEDKLLLYFKSNSVDYDMVLLSDYNKGLLTPNFLKEIIAECNVKGIKVIVDPKGTDFNKYYNVNIIKPNKKEASIASGILIKDSESLKAACVKLKQITNCDHVIITMSEDGIAQYSGSEVAIIPTKSLSVIDVTGAGDTVLAALGFALAAGNSINEACDFANHAAAVVVSKVGSAVATLDEIRTNIKN